MKVYKIVSILIICIICIFGILYIVTDKKEFSENENRYLADFPEFSFESLIEGEYIKKLEEYMIDHIAYRDVFIGLETSVLQIIGQNKINGIYIGEDDFYIEEYTVKKEETHIPYETLNQFELKLNEDINTTLMLVPTASEIYIDKLPKISANTSQKEVIDYVYAKIQFNTIDIYDELIQNKEKELLYYKLDHHWTSYGAEIAYIEYMEKLGKEYVKYDLSEVTDNFLGTIYSKLNIFNPNQDKIHAIPIEDGEYILKNPITNESFNNIYFEEYLNEKDKYSYFIGQNQPILEITNINIGNGESIAIIKDSYANRLIPFLVNEFEKIYIIDPRYYRESISEYINEKEIDEVLIIYNMNTIENDLGIGTIK